ncbi:MAG: SurA N-terminal domain-containing protein [Deltaproteobacteria bacterium]|nr:SurA N-terminal domain-containing protein [Deltaproteobacteria bacterium]
MLSLMREKASSWLIKVILGAIVIVFVFWGVGSFKESHANRAATVNGAAISLDDYKRSYNNYLENLRRQYGDNLTPDMIELLQVPRQVIEGLVSQKLMAQEAETLNIHVSDPDLVTSVQNMPAFQEAGAFSNRRYQSLLNRLQLTPEQFEASQREALLIDKLQSFITSGIKAGDSEIQEWYKWQEASVSIDYVQFDPADHKDIEIPEAQLEEYFQDHNEAYMTEPRVRVHFLEFAPDNFEASVQVQEEEIADYYESNTAEFKTDKTVEARHILLKVESTSAVGLVDKRRKEIEDILKLAREGKDFAELAGEHSEGPTRNKGGYLGEFSKETMVKPFADVAFSMKAGEISEPVLTRFGWHLIKVEKVTEASTEDLATASDKIRKKLAEEAARELAYEAAEAALETSFDVEELEKLSAENYHVLTTDYFTRKGPQMGVGEPDRFAEIAFDMMDGDISDVQQFGGRYYIMQRIDLKPEKIPEFDTVKDSVRLDAIKQKQGELARADATALLNTVEKGADLKTAAEKYSKTVGNTGLFKRNEQISNIGREPEIARTAFTLSAENKLAPTVLKGRKGYFVIQLKDRKTPDLAQLENMKATIQQSLLQQKRQRFFEKWLTELRAQSDIVIQEGIIN